METLIIYKLIVSIVVVVVLSEISKRVNPLLGGILSGLPLGTGMAVYFFSYEKGIDYLISGIPWAVASLSASIIFCLVYFLSARKMSGYPKLISIMVSSFSGSICFAAVGYVLSQMSFNLVDAVLLFMMVFIINIKLIRKLLTQSKQKSESKSSLTKILFRGIIVGMIVLLVTGLGVALGSRWSGILSSFPSTLFPLIVILQYEEGNQLFPFVIKGFSYSVSTLVVFYISFFIFAPIWGLNFGFLITYVICCIYLYLFFNTRNLFNRFRKGHSN